jgi:hypothetical protein
MAVNRYDSPAQDKYFNTYVPLPYEQIMPVVAARQAQLEREQEMLNKTFEDTKNIKYIPGTKDEGYVRDYLGNVSGLVDKYYGADLSDPVVKQQMRSAFSKMTNKQNIQNIQSSYDAWSTNQKYKAQLKAEGLYDPSIDEDPATLGQWDTVGSGRVYDYIAPAYKNPRPVGEQYFNNLKPSDLGPKGDYFFQGITSDDIDRVVDAKWGEFSNTSEGNLYVKKIAKERGLDYTNPEVRKSIATEYLKGVGEEFMFEDRGNMTPEAQLRLAKGKKGNNPKRNTLSTLPSPDINVPTTNSSRKIYKADTERSNTLKQNIAELTKQLNKVEVGSTNYEVIKSRINDLNDERNKIENTIAEVRSKVMPGYDANKQVILNDYLDKSAINGIDEEIALEIFDEASNEWGKAEIRAMNTDKNFVHSLLDESSYLKDKPGKKILAKLYTPKVLSNALLESRELVKATKKYGVEAVNNAIMAYEDIDKLDRQADRNISNEYKDAAIKRQHDNMYVLAGTGIGASDVNPNFITSEGIEKLSETSVLLNRLRTQGGSFGQLKDISIGDKKYDKIEDIQNHILSSSTVSLNRISPSVDADGDYNFIVDTYTKTDKGRDIVKTFNIKLNKFENPETTESFINAFANDLEAKGYHTQSARLRDPMLEIEFNSKKNDENILIAPDPNNPNEVAKITKVGDDEYMFIDPEGRASVDNNGRPAPINYDEVIMQLYGWRVKDLYYSEE